MATKFEEIAKARCVNIHAQGQVYNKYRLPDAPLESWRRWSPGDLCFFDLAERRGWHMEVVE